MDLSNDLISKFVKMTNDSSTKKNDKTSSYGTAIEYDGSMYVKLDGSDLLTPVDTSTVIHENDRVIVDINKHNAVVSGNISNPSVSGVEIIQLDNKLTLEFQEGLADLLLIFKDGYYEGITTVNKDGITVSHTKYGGYTKMSYDGFYLNNGSNDVLKCTSKGLVYTGTITASDIQSIDGTFEIDKEGNITGATFKTSSGGNFSIDENGDMTAKGLNVEDTISANTIICKDILNKAYPKTLVNAVNIYINSSDGDDSNECVNGSIFRTLQSAIDSIPKFLNGRAVYIHLQQDIVGNADFSYFVSGNIFLLLNGYTLYGCIRFYNTTTSINIYGGTNKDTTVGTIHPYIGMSSMGRSSSIISDRSQYISLQNIVLYAPDNQSEGLTGDKVGMSMNTFSQGYISNVKIVNCGIGFRAGYGSQIHVYTTSGVASNYGFQSTSGGKISFSNNNQSGGITAATTYNSGGQIWMDKPTFESGGASSSSNTASTTTNAKAATYTSNSAQALQYADTSSAFWRTDCKPKAGNWGYGAHTGWWFFGDCFENMLEKEVSKIEITFTREKAGYHAATTHNFYVHNYETQPQTTKPSYVLSKIATASVEAQTTYTITITDGTIIDLIKRSKGICCVPPSQSNSYYSVMSAIMKVKFIYK